MSKHLKKKNPNNLKPSANSPLFTKANDHEIIEIALVQNQEKPMEKLIDTKSISQSSSNIVSLTKKEYGDPLKYQDHILEQYKLYITSIEQNTSRRNIANSFFLTLHTATITAAATFYKGGINELQAWMFIPWSVLTISCYFWYRLVMSYKQLNTGKFKVLQEIEKHLPLAIWVEAEWKILGSGKDPNLYIPISHIERWIPVFMALGYFGLLLMGLIPRYIQYTYTKLMLGTIIVLIFLFFLLKVYLKEHKIENKK